MIKTVKTGSAALVVMIVALTAQVKAQRLPNLSIAHYWGKAEHLVTFIKDNDAILIDGNGNAGNYFIQWRITNAGATANDTIAVSDTVKIKTPWTTYKIEWGQGQFSNGMKQHDTIFITPGTNPVTLPAISGITGSADSVLTQWCDSVYFISGDAANPAVEADVSNDTICNAVYVTHWSTDIDDVIGGSGIMLYPNPVSNQLNIKLDRSTPRGVKIINGLGYTVYSRSFADTPYIGPLTINVAHLPSGLYLVLLETKTGRFSEELYIK